MLSVDTNILLFSLNSSCPEHGRALHFIRSIRDSDQVLLCEYILVELYLLLRNPRVLEHPLGAKEAVDICNRYRRHPRWQLVESAPVMDGLWKRAGTGDFPRRRIIDGRIALTLIHHGVNEFATHNEKDFLDFGFKRVWSPLQED